MSTTVVVLLVGRGLSRARRRRRGGGCAPTRRCRRGRRAVSGRASCTCRARPWSLPRTTQNRSARDRSRAGGLHTSAGQLSSPDAPTAPPSGVDATHRLLARRTRSGSGRSGPRGSAAGTPCACSSFRQRSLSARLDASSRLAVGSRGEDGTVLDSAGPVSGDSDGPTQVDWRAGDGGRRCGVGRGHELSNSTWTPRRPLLSLPCAHAPEAGSFLPPSSSKIHSLTLLLVCTHPSLSAPVTSSATCHDLRTRDDPE